MKNDALRFFGFARLFALGTLSGLLCGGAIAATASVISLKQQNVILKDPGTAVLGAKDPEVTVVEYFDYNCPYCRKLAPSIHALIESDRKVAVVFKEWPIFGGISVYAARCALASQWQGKYLAAHDALISAPRLSQETFTVLPGAQDARRGARCQAARAAPPDCRGQRRSDRDIPNAWLASALGRTVS